MTHQVFRQTLVPYTAQQMYDLVNAIADYPKFLPWCKNSKVLASTESSITATLVLVKGGVHKAFTTKNHLTPYERIDIELVDGPFKHLTGHWRFQTQKAGCLVSVNLEFEFAGKILSVLLTPVFNEIAQTLVHAFTQEAHSRYAASHEGIYELDPH